MARVGGGREREDREFSQPMVCDLPKKNPTSQRVPIRCLTSAPKCRHNKDDDDGNAKDAHPGDGLGNNVSLSIQAGDES
ncbi:hypothetical protein ZHAS_00015437 [Anopheles sinensis]|uniref:Uncharacterized protein n=1 Tax=Anopheles sinensis TaxID=74873 RepID=A0A084WAU5_ANOSI|nr:hypothetical protein ZHAS_00015437 [Anopheles sinensis]